MPTRPLPDGTCTFLSGPGTSGRSRRQVTSRTISSGMAVRLKGAETLETESSLELWYKAVDRTVFAR